jgi:hypothetical protein
MNKTGLAVLVVVLTAGCLGGGPSSDVQTATPTPVQTATSTAVQTPTPSASGPAGDPAHCPPIATPTSQTTTATEPSQAGTPTATVSGFTYGPDRETPLILWNEWTDQVEMRVQISCEATAETVHDETYTLSQGDRREPFNLTTVTPEGAGSSVTVGVSVRNMTDNVTLKTTDCADVTARVTDDGSLQVDASAC